MRRQIKTLAKVMSWCKSFIRRCFGSTTLLFCIALLMNACGPKQTNTRLSGVLVPAEIARRSRLALVSIVALNNRGEVISSGSGFFVNDNGVLVTNLHVIDNAQKLRVKLHTEEVYEVAYLRHADEQRDIAVLRIPAHDTPWLPLSEASEMPIGTRLYAMGNPLAMEGTFSDGVLSAYRMLDGTRMIQMTTPISPGSSGGPVLDDYARVIGVSTAKRNGGENLNLTVPAYYITPMLDLPGERSFSAASLNEALGRPSPPTSPQATASDRDNDTPNPHVENVRQQLNSASEYARDNGLVQYGNDVFRSIRQGQRTEVSMTVSAGKAIMVVGVCDEDCSDLDMRLRDPQGRVVAEDRKDNAVPVVILNNATAGDYTIEMSMIQCSHNPCITGVRAFQAGNSTSGGDEDPIRTVTAQLERLTEEFEDRGLTQLGNDVFKTLRERETARTGLYLRAGQAALVVAACDGDCSDVDLRLLDEQGREVQRDTENNDTPAVVVTDAIEGDYTVIVSMASCSHEPCAVGIRAFEVAQREPQDQPHVTAVRRQLEQLTTAAEEKGLRQYGNDVLEGLRNGEDLRTSMYLQAGQSVLVVGVCDNDCSDVDMRIFDSSGRLVAHDTDNGDDTPIATIHNPVAGDYTVVIAMESCSREPCTTGVRAFVPR